MWELEPSIMYILWGHIPCNQKICGVGSMKGAKKAKLDKISYSVAQNIDHMFYALLSYQRGATLKQL